MNSDGILGGCLGHKYRVWSIISSLGLTVSLSACVGKMSSSKPATATLQSVSGDTSVGQALYENNCRVCHGPISNSPKRGRTAAQIRQALDLIPNMNALTGLTSAEVEAIASALQLTSAPPASSSTASVAPNLQGRDYIESNFKTLFTNEAGRSLYSVHCNSCHAGVDSRSNRSFEQIRGAIKNINEMKSLSSLSDAEIRLIAGALSSSISADEINVLNVIKNKATKQGLAFGGPCGRYDRADFNDRETCIELGEPYGGNHKLTAAFAMAGPTNALRSAKYRHLCENVLELDGAVLTALNHAGLSPSSSVNSSSVAQIFDLFFPGRPLSSEVSKALIHVGQSSKSLGHSATDNWRFVMLAICNSAAGESL